jgi:hypothetical protein
VIVESLKPPITYFLVVNWLLPFGVKLCFGWVYIAPCQIQQMSMQLQFCNTYLFRKEVRQGIHAIWLTCCWTIWKERNNRIFSNKERKELLILIMP